MRNALLDAFELHEAGRLDSAACRYERVLTQDEANADALHGLGVLSHQQGDHARAVERIGRAVVLRPDFALAHNDLGVCLRELHDFDAAALHFRRAVELDPACPLAQSNLGQLLLESGQVHEALPHCQEAVRLRPQSVYRGPDRKWSEGLLAEGGPALRRGFLCRLVP